jgi:hypothetical protein
MFHLTHRCHNRAFLLKFAWDRDIYLPVDAAKRCEISGLTGPGPTQSGTVLD